MSIGFTKTIEILHNYVKGFIKQIKEKLESLQHLSTAPWFEVRTGLDEKIK